ncbi:rod shape-determining protein [Halomicrobium salinisoli]|uniref:rod shape-determining protein n=1 Tax=Halomicrobium salinisoli TaxID=2878391 RepID=UPI001CF001C9|nr:rod shape-determining protein [Halomicrobium salinisoli]
MSDDADEAEPTAAGAEDNGGAGTTVPIGVKLGSTRTVVSLPGDRGADDQIIRTLTCLATYEDALTGEEKVLYGEEAATEYPDRVQFMLRSGLPEDADRAELTRKFFEALIEENDLPGNSAVVYAIPTIDNPEGLENLRSVIENSSIGMRLVESYPESLCGAIPAFGDDLQAIDEIFLAINMGSTNLEASAYRRGEQLAPFTTGAVTGNEVDRMIANYVEEETQGRVNIDTQTAREYKEEHADFVDFEPFTDVIQQPGGGSHEFTIERSVMDALDEYIDDAVEEIANTFLPELANDYMKVYQLALDRPIVITGGMACIPGITSEFERRLGEELDRDVEVIAADRPDLAPTIGAQRIAQRLAEND